MEVPGVESEVLLSILSKYSK